MSAEIAGLLPMFEQESVLAWLSMINRCSISGLTNNSCGVIAIGVLLDGFPSGITAFVGLLGGLPMSMTVTIARQKTPMLVRSMKNTGIPFFLCFSIFL